MIIYSDEIGFEKALASSDVCLVDFYATWCGPCRMLNNELIALEDENFNIIKIDIDECPNLSDQFKIDAVPTMFIFKNQQPVKKLQGYITKDQILSNIKNYL